MGGATLTPSPPPADPPIVVSCLSNRVFSRTFLRWELTSTHCMPFMCIFTLQLKLKIFPQEFHSLPPSAPALNAVSCLLKRGQASKQCVPPRTSHSTHLTTHFVDVYTHFQSIIHISFCTFANNCFPLYVLLHYVCFRTFRVQVNVTTIATHAQLQVTPCAGMSPQTATVQRTANY